MFEQTQWYNRLPNENIDVYEPHLRLFFETMYERMFIWKRRFIDKTPRPWTTNKIFNESKFTNVYRELDRNSQWQIKNILLDKSLSPLNLVWKTMVFRYFNNIETFNTGISEMHWNNGIPNWNDYNEDEFANFINRLRKTGVNPYTNAYVINSRATPKDSRDYCYTRLTIPKLHDNMLLLFSYVKNAKSANEIIKYLKTLPCVADFIAHEFYQDFTYISKYTNVNFMRFTQNDYTNVGPGASIGIRLIYPNLKTIKQQKTAIYLLRDCAEEWLTKIGNENGEKMVYLNWDKENEKYILDNKCNITLHQIEMWLCEFQKYWKMIIGDGKKRSKFIPKTKNLIVGG